MFWLLIFLLVVWALFSAAAHSEAVQDWVVLRHDYAAIRPADVTPDDTLVIYFRGNCEHDVTLDTPHKVALAPVVARDLPATYKAAVEFYQQMAAHRPKHLVLYGYSLGAHVAAYVSSKFQCDALHLEAPLVSLEDSITHVLRGATALVPGRPARGRIETVDLLQRSRCNKIRIAVASNDHMMPHSDAMKEWPVTVFQTATHFDIRNHHDAWSEWAKDLQ